MAKISLVRFRVLGYRSCKDAGISFSPDITALIGANGSGKTNILQALMLFSQPSGGAPRQKETYSQECRVEVDFLRARKLVQYQATITYRSNPGNQDEALAFYERWNLTGKKSSRIGWITNREMRDSVRKLDGNLYVSIPTKGRSKKLES
jgi:recombinational DNA repair ATPase RecF